MGFILFAIALACVILLFEQFMRGANSLADRQHEQRNYGGCAGTSLIVLAVCAALIGLCILAISRSDSIAAFLRTVR